MMPRNVGLGAKRKIQALAASLFDDHAEAGLHARADVERVQRQLEVSALDEGRIEDVVEKPGDRLAPVLDDGESSRCSLEVAVADSMWPPMAIALSSLRQLMAKSARRSSRPTADSGGLAFGSTTGCDGFVSLPPTALGRIHGVQ